MYLENNILLCFHLKKDFQVPVYLFFIASWHVDSATASKAEPTFRSRFFRIFGSTLGRFQAAKNLLTAVSPMPVYEITEKGFKFA